jgi:phosphomannomutase
MVLGYEQALGYLVAPRPLDKDGITAAVLMAEIAAVAASEGRTLQDRLDAISARFGRYVTAELSVKMPPADAAAWVSSVEADPPAQVGGRSVAAVSTYPEANLVRLMLDGGVRLQIRPSGTEPKVKLYGEAVDLDPAELRSLLEALTHP